MCMKQPDISAIGIRYNSNKINRSRDNERINSRNGNKVLLMKSSIIMCMAEECPALRYELQEFNKYFTACNRNVRRFCINEFSDIEIGKAEPIYCNETCRAGFPDITLDMTAELDKM